MGNKVGPKGQVVIEKEIRERLGVQPGWNAVQSLVDNHVEIHFLPPEHNRSLAGALSAYALDRPLTDEEMEDAIEAACAEAACEDFPAEGNR